MGLNDVLSGLFGLSAEQLLLNDAIQSAEQSGDDALATAQNVAGEVTEASTFQPYSITSGGGAVDALAQDGRFSGLNLNLSPEDQAVVDSLRSVAVGQAGVAGQDSVERAKGMLEQFGFATEGRTESEIFDLLNAVQEPARERERLALEGRLFSQGRSGVRTAQFGGTPEQLALAKAQEEQRAGTAVNAFNLAREDDDRRFRRAEGLLGLALQEKGLGADVTNSLLSSSFLPTDDLRRTATLGVDIGSVDQQARTEALRTGAGLTESGLEGKIKADELATMARIYRNQQLADILLGSTNEEGVNAGGLFDKILDLF